MDNYEFKLLGKPLRFPVYDNDTHRVVIPAGAEGVEIAYGQSSKTYKDKKTGKTKHQNVYRWKGQIYNT